MIGIVGNGFVGQATRLLETDNQKFLIYDVDSSKCVPVGLTLEGMLNCKIIFICVPTPMNPDGSCCTSIVEKVINNLREINFKNHIVVRSTVTPGFSQKHKVNFMPEFLTEKNWADDVYNCENWIIGKYDLNTDYLQDLLNRAMYDNKIKYNKLITVSPMEGEMIKYVRNTFLATKISFFNEIEELCRKNYLNYNLIKNNVSLDTRIGNSHMDVPGYDGKRGFGGTCLPKDLNSLRHFMVNECGLKSYILDAACRRNDETDRPLKDWHNDRTISKN